MICAPLDTEGPRFRVITIEGYPITPGAACGTSLKPVLVATVLDSFYGSEHGRYASNDRVTKDGRVYWGKSGSAPSRGKDGALAAAAERCAELNAWHERQGWGEDVPLVS